MSVRMKVNQLGQSFFPDNINCAPYQQLGLKKTIQEPLTCNKLILLQSDECIQFMCCAVLSIMATFVK